jgi:hypothetical protein
MNELANSGKVISLVVNSVTFEVGLGRSPRCPGTPVRSLSAAVLSGLFLSACFAAAPPPEWLKRISG